MNTNKYYPDSVKPRTNADPVAKELAQRTVDTFETVKLNNPEMSFEELMNTREMIEAHEKIQEHNNWSANVSQIRGFADVDKKAVKYNFTDCKENVCDEIVSSRTPEEVTNKLEYYDNMIPTTSPPQSRVDRYTNSDDSSESSEQEAIYRSVTPSNSSSEEGKGKTQDPESSTLGKRKRDDEDDDTAGPSKRQNVEDFLEDTGPSLFDFTGD